MANYSTETFVKVFDDDNGFHILIGPDRDGLECCEIRYVDAADKNQPSIVMDWPMAVMVAQAVLALANERP
jgi:hypothetical protein